MRHTIYWWFFWSVVSVGLGLLSAGRQPPVKWSLSRMASRGRPSSSPKTPRGRPSRRSRRRPRNCRPTSRRSPGPSCRSWTMRRTRPDRSILVGRSRLSDGLGVAIPGGREFRSPRGRFRDRLPGRPAAPGRQQRRPLPRHGIRGLRLPPQPGRAVVHAGRVRRDRAAAEDDPRARAAGAGEARLRDAQLVAARPAGTGRGRKPAGNCGTR